MILHSELLVALSRVKDRRVLVEVSPNRYRMPIFDELEERLGRELTDAEATCVVDVLSGYDD
jgi:hypothetical protein